MKRNFLIILSCLSLAGCESILDDNLDSSFESLEETSKSTVSKKKKSNYELGEVYYSSNNKEDMEKAFEFFQWSAEKGNKYAQYKLGIMYLDGTSVDKDINQAITWLKMSAASGLVVAQLALGDLYYEGRQPIERNLYKAKNWYNKAAEMRNVSGMVKLADTYRQLDKTPNHNKLALDWYLRASSFGSSEAKFKAANLFITGIEGEVKKDLDKALELYQEAAADGYNDALAAVGELYAKGHGVARDINRAQELFLNAAEQGSSKAAYNLAMLYEIGDGVGVDMQRAAKWYQEAQKNNFPYASYKLGEMYMLARGVEQNISLANEMFSIAAEKGIILAYVKLGDHYLEGIGFERNIEKAFTNYQYAAEHNEPYAAYMLSIMYMNGWGTKMDFAKSVLWQSRADQLSGSAIAKFHIAKNYENGFGLPKEKAESFKWLASSAADGYVEAQIQLGELLLQKKDLSGAYKWFDKALKQHSARAEYNVGIMFYNGEVVNQDYNEAAKLFTIAAKKGLTSAQYQLSELYKYGIGVPKDIAASFAWWSISVKDKIEDSSKYLRDQFVSMSIKDRARALQLEKDFKRLYVR